MDSPCPPTGGEQSGNGSGTVLLDIAAVSDLDATDFVFYEPPAEPAPIDGM